jgi:hypothetical protein
VFLPIELASQARLAGRSALTVIRCSRKLRQPANNRRKVSSRDSPGAHAVPWTAQATGTGAQTLEFVAQQQPGDQVVVVMNADGSGTVSGSAASMVTQPSLTWIGSSLLSGGIIIGVGAVLLVIRGARRHSSAP